MNLDKAKLRLPANVNKMNKQSSTGRTGLLNNDLYKNYMMLDINKLLPYKNQARLEFDSKELEELAESIKQYGILQPLRVLPVDEARQYEIVSGERRYRAAKLAGLDKIPCIIDTDENTTDIKAVLENIHRKDLTPFEFAKAIKILKNNGLENKDISDQLSVSLSRITEALQLLDLPDKVKEVMQNQKSYSRAITRMVVKLKDEKLQLKLLSGKGKLPKTYKSNKDPYAFKLDKLFYLDDKTKQIAFNDKIFKRLSDHNQEMFFEFIEQIIDKYKK